MKNDLLLFHAMPFDQVRRELIHPDPQLSDQEYLPAYRWLETQIGFFPHFFALGKEDDEEALRMCGYQCNWRRLLSYGRDADGKYTYTLCKAGEHLNLVLFAFSPESMEKLSYSDYMWWNIVLTEVTCDREVEPVLHRRLFKPSWNPAKWRSLARKNGHAVQVVCPALDLSQAKFVYVRNRATQQALLKQGFENVLVKRIPVEID